MIDFIERDGDPQLPPPYEFRTASIRSFRLAADLGKLQVLCDQQLNIGTLQERGFEYRALFPFVDLEVVDYPVMECANPPYAAMGYTSQHELYFRFWVLKYETIGNFLLPVPDLAMFFPYMFVDNPWSVISGREVVGFPKVGAQITLGNPYPLEASTDVFTQYAPQTKLAPQTFVTVNAGGLAAPAVPPTGTWPFVGIDLGVLKPEVQGVLEETQLEMGPFAAIQLKQFRDGQDTATACYQALLHSQFEVANVSPLQPLPAGLVVVNEFASLQIPANLGLAAAGHPLQPQLQYEVQCDLRFGNTQDLFVRSAGGVAVQSPPDNLLAVLYGCFGIV